MNTYDGEAFFPKREGLRPKRPRARVDVPLDPSEVRFRRIVTGVSVSVAVFTQVFAIAVVFGWIPLRLSLEVLLSATSCVLVVASALAAVRLRRAFLRASNRSS